MTIYIKNPVNGSSQSLAAIAALQFWTADVKAHALSSAIEQVCNAFFYLTSTYMLCQQHAEVLCGHFVTTLNATIWK